MDFDFKRAYTEVALPAFIALPPVARELVQRVHTERDKISQDKTTLDCVGTSLSLSADFATLAGNDPVTLASASLTVYSTGHWAFDDTQGKGLQIGGVYWKFSNLADQALVRAMGISRNRDAHVSGMNLAVHQGIIRVQFATPETWTWTEVGLATPETLAAVRAASWTPYARPTSRSERDAWVDSQKDIARGLRTAFKPRDCPVAGFFDLKQYGTVASNL